MNAAELFEIWSPSTLKMKDGAPPWSDWTKPVVFSSIRGAPDQPPLTELTSATLKDCPIPAPHEGCAFVVNLPGAESVAAGIDLARRGYRPVPLFNASPAPDGVMSSFAVDVTPIANALCEGAFVLRDLQLPPEAPPAFLLDSQRLAARGLNPGSFDNRWIVLPQDFPSANLLLARGITKIIVLQQIVRWWPKEDLAHVLRRWQDAGIEVLAKASGADPAQSVVVSRPSRFRSLFYVGLALVGLRLNSAGGFGGIIPMPSSGGGGHFG